MDTTNDDSTTQTRKILFLTNSESGQANTILAMALEATTRPHVEVHLASFPDLKQRVERLSPKIHFHPLDGKRMGEMMRAPAVAGEMRPHPPTTKSYRPYGRMMEIILATWDGECAFCFVLFFFGCGCN